MSNLESKFISLLKFNSQKDYLEYDFSKNTVDTIEMIEIENFDINLIEEFKVKNNFFLIPNYVTYLRETQSFDFIIESLSKNKKKKIRKVLKIFEEVKEEKNLKIIIEEQVSQELFDKWFNLYIQCLSEKERGILLLNKKWPTIDIDKCTKMGVFVLQGDRVIGGIIGRSFKKNSWIDRRFSISYSAIDKDFKSIGINDYINLLMIELAYKHNFKYISRGKDTNLYGKHLSSGIPIFKCSLGYKIIPYKSEPTILVRFNDLSYFNFPIFFTSYSNEDKQFNSLIANLIIGDTINIDFSLYKLQGCKCLRVYKYLHMNNNLELIEEIEY